MGPAQSRWVLVLSRKVYEQLLQFYPKSYRQRYAPDMLRTFSDCCHFAFREGGSIALFKLWLPTLADFSLTVVEKHLDEGLLSSGVTIIRAVSFAILVCAAVMYATAWDSGIEILLAATLLLIVGVLGLFFTSPGGSAMLKRRLGRSGSIIPSQPESQQQQSEGKIRRDDMAEQFGRGFWLRWVSASGLGLIIGFAVYFAFVVGFASELSVGLQIVSAVVCGAILGAAIGIAQWLVLRRQVFQPHHWLIASIVGGSVGGTVALVIRVIVLADSTISFLGNLVIGGAIVGISLGIAGWLVLRRHVSRAGWWVLASAVGISLGLSMSNALGQGLNSLFQEILGEGAARFLAMLTYGGLLLTAYGAITGTVLVWLFRQPATTVQERSQVTP